MARTNRPDEAYHIPTLNFWFAISSIVLLITCVWMIWADYNRSWKVHQREFREFEISRVSNEKALAEAQLEEDDVKAKLSDAEAKLAAAEEALTGKRDEVTAVDDDISKLSKALYVAKQNFNFKGADLGKAKYDAEHDFKHYAGDAAKLKKVLTVPKIKMETLWLYLLQLVQLREQKFFPNVKLVTVLLKGGITRLVLLYGMFLVDRLVPLKIINTRKPWLHMEKSGRLKKWMVF